MGLFNNSSFQALSWLHYHQLPFSDVCISVSDCGCFFQAESADKSRSSKGCLKPIERAVQLLALWSTE